MVARADRRGAPLNAFRRQGNPNQKVSFVDRSGRQTDKDLARRRLIDRLNFLIKEPGVQKENFIRLSTAAGAPNSGLVKQVVTPIENQLLSAGIRYRTFRFRSSVSKPEGAAQ